MNEAQWEASRPLLTRDNELVIEVWNFCGGWKPEFVPFAAAYYGVEDLDMLIAQLLAVRRVTEAHERAIRGARS